MKIRFGFMIAIAMTLLAGCATKPQLPVELSMDATGAESGRIGVAMTALPKLDTQVPGAGCLLCLAVASAANSGLTTHAQTLPYEDLPMLKDKVAKLLRVKGSDVIVIKENLILDDLPSFAATGANVARKDFSSFQLKYDIKRLVVLDIVALGFTRSYSAYIPTSDPKALFRGVGYMVNLKNNSYDWYKPVYVEKSADLKWDEPPKFPGLTNAYFQALEVGMDRLLEPFIVDPLAKADQVDAKVFPATAKQKNSVKQSTK